MLYFHDRCDIPLWVIRKTAWKRRDDGGMGQFFVSAQKCDLLLQNVQFTLLHNKTVLYKVRGVFVRIYTVYTGGIYLWLGFLGWKGKKWVFVPNKLSKIYGTRRLKQCKFFKCIELCVHTVLRRI